MEASNSWVVPRMTCEANQPKSSNARTAAAKPAINVRFSRFTNFYCSPTPLFAMKQWSYPLANMRILLAHNSLYYPSYGGGDKSNRLLVEALAARGHEV